MMSFVNKPITSRSFAIQAGANNVLQKHLDLSNYFA